MSQQRQQQRCLWNAQKTTATVSNESYASIAERFSTRPKHRSYFKLCANAVVTVQEFALSSFLLARYRISLQESVLTASRQGYMDASSVCIFFALLLSVVYSAKADPTQQQNRKTKVVERSLDALLLGVWLRFIAGVLRSLTASYSSDTVEALAVTSMLIHLLVCDYSYANGRAATPAAAVAIPATSRPAFRGGTVSLNAALFSTTLLVSRLQQSESFYYVCLAIVLFAFYPATRHAISVSYPASQSVATWFITTAIVASTILLLLILEGSLLLIAFCAVSVSLGFVLPAWKFVVQRAKVLVRGPWDIPSCASMQLDYVIPNKSIREHD